jgi:hypothetical protein
MLKRFALTFFSLCLLLTGVLISMAPLPAIRTRLDAPTFVMVLCLWTALVILVLIVVAGKILPKIWFFRGTGDPVSLEQVHQRLLTINDLPCPVTAIAARKKMIFTWRIRETQWCELFSRLGISRLYELHCRFDADTRTVFLSDRIRRADFLICPDEVKIGRRRIPLPLLRVKSRRLGTIEQYATVEAYDYALHPREIKSPIMGTILACGWNVRFSLF